jgi:hypothetical protein
MNSAFNGANAIKLAIFATREKPISCPPDPSCATLMNAAPKDSLVENHFPVALYECNEEIELN